MEVSDRNHRNHFSAYILLSLVIILFNKLSKYRSVFRFTNLTSVSSGPVEIRVKSFSSEGRSLAPNPKVNKGFTIIKNRYKVKRPTDYT